MRCPGRTDHDIDTLEQIANEAREKRSKQIEVCEELIREELSKAKLLGL
jgi:glutamyl-tRNA reductase